MTPEPELPQSIDAIMASIRQSLAEEPLVADPAAPAALARAAPLPPLPAASASITLDALVRSMLAPMLKEWLDAHLPEIVETATHAEIRRLTGRAD